MSNHTTRRAFLGSVAAAAAAASALPRTVWSQSTQPSAPRARLRQFTHADVKLTAGPLKDQFDHALKYYMALDEDRVLKTYRQLAKQDAPGENMGGWYDPGAFAPGHALGQWLSALSRFYQSTGDPAIKAKIERLIDGFDKTLDGPGNYYDGHRFANYCYDKHVIGLTEAYALAGVTRAKDVLARATDRALPHLHPKALTREEQAARPHKDVSYTWDESYTMPENLFYAHEVFGDARYLDMAKRHLHDKPFFDPLSRGENVLPGLHAYSHVNCLSSGAKAYLVLVDEKYLKAITNAWDMLEQTQWFASSGWGPNETFVKPHSGGRGDSLTHTHNHFETPCGSYAQFKLARYLTRITANPRYLDGLELMLYNGILAAKEMGKDGQTFYYSDYSPLARKTYYGERWPCCSGTYPQVVADYLVSAYFHNDAGIYVNLYTPSEVQWNGVTLTQQTNYPDDSKITLKISTPKPTEFDIHLRIPSWYSSGGALKVNGAEEFLRFQPGSFTDVRRTWKDGDTVELTFPLTYRAVRVDDKHPNLVALMRGPVMLVATPDATPTLPANFVTAANDAGQSAERLPDSGARMTPFYKVRDEPYTAYLARA